MLTRRDFLAASGAAACWPYGGALAQTRGVVVNDLHSQLTATRVNRIAVPASLDNRLKSCHKATELITEIYCERDALPRFFADVREDFHRHQVNVIYGTVRLIEPDRESFLPWAKAAYACTIFNLHVVHTAEGLRHAADAFRRLIDLGVRHGGSYYLTYHKYATRKQVETCYPRFAEFLRLKRKYDPGELFQSDWYRHYRGMFA